MVRTLAIAVGAALVVSGLAAQQPYSLDDLSFLVGCWSGVTGDLDRREQWTSADGGLMLGTTRFLRDGAVVDYEFGRMEERDGVVTYWPYPRGTISEHGFPLVGIADGEYVFENLEHDFPVRIVYRRVGEDRLEPRIEGRDGQATGWTLSRVECPG